MALDVNLCKPLLLFLWEKDLEIELLGQGNANKIQRQESKESYSLGSHSQKEKNLPRNPSSVSWTELRHVTMHKPGTIKGREVM